MAGVNNPPNLKPLIDNQSTAQSTELTAAAQAINTSIDTAKAELVAESNSAKTVVNEAKTQIIDDAQAKSEALAGVVEAAKNAVLDDISEKINALQLTVDAPKSPIKSIQRGVVGMAGSYFQIVNIATVDLSKSFIVSSSASDQYSGAHSVVPLAKFESASAIRVYQRQQASTELSWEVIEYV